MEVGCVVFDFNLNGSFGLVLIFDLLVINLECCIVVLIGYVSIVIVVDVVKLGVV